MAHAARPCRSPTPKPAGRANASEIAPGARLAQRVVHALDEPGNAIGVIAVTRRETGSFSADHHVELLQTFADQAVIAIENVRLFNETQEALERQTATADILKVIACSPSDVQPVFEPSRERQPSARWLLGSYTASSTTWPISMAFTP